MNITILLSFLACGDSTAKSIKDNPPVKEKDTTEQKKEELNIEKNEKKTTPEQKKPEKVMLKAKTGMPDLLAGLSTGGCDSGPGVYGASSYFHNKLKVSDGKVTGTETWILYPNKKMASKWSAQGINGKCEVIWNLTGTSTGSNLNLVNDLVNTTCPKEIVNKYQDTNQKINYKLTKNSDGTANFFFLKSGKLIGEGHHKGTSLQFITSHSCKWF